MEDRNRKRLKSRGRASLQQLQPCAVKSLKPTCFLLQQPKMYTLCVLLTPRWPLLPRSCVSPTSQRHKSWLFQPHNINLKQQVRRLVKYIVRCLLWEMMIGTFSLTAIVAIWLRSPHSARKVNMKDCTKIQDKCHMSSLRRRKKLEK